MPRRLNFDEKTGQVLPKEENLLQYFLEDVEKQKKWNKSKEKKNNEIQ